MSTESSYNNFINTMANEILSKLNGTHPNFKRFEFPDSPSKIIILGTLGDKSKDYSSCVGDTTRTLTSVKNNSMSVKFLTKDNKGVVMVKPSLSLYYRVYPTLEEEKAFISENYDKIPEKVELARIWKRYDCEFEPFTINISKAQSGYPLNFKPLISTIKNDENVYKRGEEIESKCLENKTTYEEKIKDFSADSPPKYDWKGTLLVQTEDFFQDNEKLKFVTITMVNETEESNKYETFFFNCNFEINLQSVKLVPFKYEYDYEEHIYHYENYLRCLNCHADYEIEKNRILTKHYAKFEQEKIVPKETINSTSFSFEELASREKNLVLLEKLYGFLLNYLTSHKNSPRYREDELYKETVDKFDETTRRFYEGLNVLKKDENALKSFELLNETFKRASRFDKWRIFQLVFILSLIPDIVDKTKRRDMCEILHVHTGGGKTEAYLGCVIFSAFYDRLSGKTFGTTAIAKFPLRMLSIQQLQRIASLFIHAEEVRKENKIEGEPFSVAYFVGSTEEFPRYTKPIIDRLKKAEREKEEIRGKIVDVCPLCSGDVILDYKSKERYIVHKCKNCGREFMLFYTDEEIYRLLPTLIVSTVDKFAGIALNRRFKNIFGGKIDRCPEGHGFIPHNDVCEVGLDGNEKCKKKGELCDINFKTGPALIIQDEMHLIREAFGTINAHFESFIEALQSEFCGYAPKRIAMTATVAGAKHQIEHLYHKRISVFPGESPEGRGNKDFFFEYDLEENTKVIQRIMIGLKPNLRDNQFASLLTLKYLSEFINDVETHVDLFSQQWGVEVEELKEMIDNYKVFLTYHNKKSDVHSMNYYLEAVVNSKLDSYKIKPKTLTGDNTLDDIKELIQIVENFPSDSKNNENLLSVFATSIVSHGIDIEKWNVMIFQGIPRSTAEYIQALSRVGRRYPGLVFVWFYPNRARDLSFYQNFADYHHIIEQKVENIPLSRWAKLGFMQTFTSIFNASILNFISEVTGEPIYKVDKVNEIFADDENRKKLIEFIKKAYITDSAMIGADYFNAEIPKETEKRLEYLKTYTGGERNFFPNALKDCEDKYYKTQYGMRGIQDEIVLKPSDTDLNFLRKVLEG